MYEELLDKKNIYIFLLKRNQAVYFKSQAVYFKSHFKPAPQHKIHISKEHQAVLSEETKKYRFIKVLFV